LRLWRHGGHLPSGPAADEPYTETMRPFVVRRVAAVVVTLGALGCGNQSPSAFTDGGAGSSSGGSSGGSGGGSSGSSGGSLLGDDGSAGDGGFVCTPNPGNYDIPGNHCDDDGDGMVDNTVVCDQSLLLQGSAHDFANAMGLCQDATATKWGIVTASYTKGYAGGTPNDGQHGIQPGFGSVITAREGSQLGILSSGFARDWDDIPGTDTGPCSVPTNPMVLGPPCFKGYQQPMSGKGTSPPGYPKAAAACPQESGLGVFDAIAVQLQIKVPLNAQGLQFDFDFYSGEWPEYVCTNFNDSFVAWLQSAAYPGHPAGDLNVSFDAKGDPVSVNNAFFDRCTMSASTGCCAMAGMGPEGCGSPTATSACAGGPGELGGTGFADDGTFCGSASTGGGATGWLTTTAPVKPGETITLQLIIWDTGDPNWDSSVLLDHFAWQPGPTMTGTSRPGAQ
jgi:hypothetical protein